MPNHVFKNSWFKNFLFMQENTHEASKTIVHTLLAA